MFSFAIDLFICRESCEYYGESSFEFAQREIFDMDVSSFSEAIASDKILSQQQRQWLIDAEKLLGYEELCKLAATVGSIITDEDIYALINGFDVGDVITSHSEPRWVWPFSCGGKNSMYKIEDSGQVKNHFVFRPIPQRNNRMLLLELEQFTAHTNKD